MDTFMLVWTVAIVVGVLALLLAADETVAEQVLLGQQLDFAAREPGFQRQH